jgi:hypothetical protein
MRIALNSIPKRFLDDGSGESATRSARGDGPDTKGEWSNYQVQVQRDDNM